MEFSCWQKMFKSQFQIENETSVLSFLKNKKKKFTVSFGIILNLDNQWEIWKFIDGNKYGLMGVTAWYSNAESIARELNQKYANCEEVIR